jgi:hypothetical protein
VRASSNAKAHLKSRQAETLLAALHRIDYAPLRSGKTQEGIPPLRSVPTFEVVRDDHSLLIVRPSLQFALQARSECSLRLRPSGIPHSAAAIRERLEHGICRHFRPLASDLFVRLVRIHRYTVPVRCTAMQGLFMTLAAWCLL